MAASVDKMVSSDQGSIRSTIFPLTLRSRRQHQQEGFLSRTSPVIAKPEEQKKRQFVSGQIRMPEPIDENFSTNAIAATTANQENLFLKLPQEIHNAIFIRLVDPSNAVRTSYVDHAGMHDLLADEDTRHVQCSTPTLRSLLPIMLTCKQLHSEFAETLSDLRSKTVHQFRILDTEDFRAFKFFFNSPNVLHYQLTPQLKVTLPADSHHLTAVLTTLAKLSDSLLESLTLELPWRVHPRTERMELFLHGLHQTNPILQLGSMVCTTVSHRRFDGMWSLRYRSIRSLDQDQRDAWVGPGIRQDVSRCMWDDVQERGMEAAKVESTGVQKWSRHLMLREA